MGSHGSTGRQGGNRQQQGPQVNSGCVPQPSPVYIQTFCYEQPRVYYYEQKVHVPVQVPVPVPIPVPVQVPVPVPVPTCYYTYSYCR